MMINENQVNYSKCCNLSLAPIWNGLNYEIDDRKRIEGTAKGIVVCLKCKGEIA